MPTRRQVYTVLLGYAVLVLLMFVWSLGEDLIFPPHRIALYAASLHALALASAGILLAASVAWVNRLLR